MEAHRRGFQLIVAQSHFLYCPLLKPPDLNNLNDLNFVVWAFSFCASINNVCRIALISLLCAATSRSFCSIRLASCKEKYHALIHPPLKPPEPQAPWKSVFLRCFAFLGAHSVREMFCGSFAAHLNHIWWKRRRLLWLLHPPSCIPQPDSMGVHPDTPATPAQSCSTHVASWRPGDQPTPFISTQKVLRN